jgi:hypothetical protein
MAQGSTTMSIGKITEFPPPDPRLSGKVRQIKLEPKQRNGKTNTDAEPRWRDNCYTAAELRRRTFPPVAFCVPDLIPEGLTLIAGKPKIGKSWLALDVCIAVALGRFCLGERKPVQGDVLYAAMEDTLGDCSGALTSFCGCSAATGLNG